jgi:GNAT superfamily N-acetyltransferase
MYKGVWRSRLAPEETDAVIDRTLAWFRDRNAPFLFWWTGPGTTPDDLGERLLARGLLSMEAQMEQLAPGIRSTELGAPCMVADLRQMNEAALGRTPEGFKIEVVTSEAGLLEFKQVLVEGYEIPEGLAHGWVDSSLAFGLDRMPWRLYLGRLDGVPVASNILFNGGGAAGVYGVATVPQARRMGIGGAITLKPLLDAREMGYRYGVLFSSDMGAGVYERIGFRRTDARINRFLWRNPGAG